MNKLIFFGLFALMFNYINSADVEPIDFTTDSDYLCVDPAELQDQFGEELDEDICYLLETSGDKAHCCYISDGNSSGHCIAITDDEFENIVRFKKYIRDRNVDEDFEIDCSSKFVTMSLFALLALLF